MAVKYIINEGYGDQETVEGAYSLRQEDGFFFFQNVAKKTVFVTKAARVTTIKRVSDED
ncbi:hypothetical protein [Microbacterium lacus]|uniref:Uncharacterized protein n=1 Tax=Microbacterium lacus TaxID=415217 RepID=A0ABN2GVK1_9MICO